MKISMNANIDSPLAGWQFQRRNYRQTFSFLMKIKKPTQPPGWIGMLSSLFHEELNGKPQQLDLTKRQPGLVPPYLHE